jgi:rusticyanin
MPGTSRNGSMETRQGSGVLRPRRKFYIVAGAVVAAAAIVTAGIALTLFSSGNQGTLSTITYSSFVSDNIPQNGVTVVPSANSIYVNGTGITLMIESTPPWANRSGDFFMSYGLVNPTFYIRHGVAVRFSLINADNEEHDLIISSLAPPYQYNEMMSGGMMWGGYHWMYGSPMLGGLQGNLSWGSRMPMFTFMAKIQNQGTYWYMCGYPGQAQSGMYGRIIVD